MPLRRLSPRLHAILGPANMYLLDAPEGLTLIDTGFPGDDRKVRAALAELGRGMADLRHIVLTHAHRDHIGSLGVLARESGARTYLHAADVEIAQAGRGFRPMTPAPGLLPKVLSAIFANAQAVVEPARIDQPLTDGDVIPLAGGLRAVHSPGHCAGQCAFLWEAEGVLFAGDVCGNLLGLGPPIGYEDRPLGERSQRRLGLLDFETAGFGHGPPILTGAAQAFRKRWPARADDTAPGAP